MTTSGVTGFSMTARDIVTAALEECAIIPLGVEPEAHEMGRCLLRLNAMLKSWAIDGVSVYRSATTTVPVALGDAAVVLPPDVRDVATASVVESSSYSRQLAKWPRSDFIDVPNRAVRGTPLAFYVERTVSGAILNLYPTPAKNLTLELDYDRIPETVTNPAETLDIIEEAQEAVFLNLGVRCAGLFQATLTEELVARAGALYAQLKDMSRPDSYFMGAYDYA